eukprot:gene9395-1642_t
MTRFRPCIDLHNGQVKQIVGGTLRDDGSATTNFVAVQPPSYFADLYKQHNLRGAHIIKLGSGNDDAAKEALRTWPRAFQLGGGITIDNAAQWLDAGAEKVIVTSWLFSEGVFDENRARQLNSTIGKDRLVIDLSCRKRSDTEGWFVAINRWQTLTDLRVDQATLERLAQYCSEFLIHAADVEGLCQGIDEDLVRSLGLWSPIPCTYAGGANHITNLEKVYVLSNGKVDLTFGSALDIFGGTLVSLDDCIAWNLKADSQH